MFLTTHALCPRGSNNLNRRFQGKRKVHFVTGLAQVTKVVLLDSFASQDPVSLRGQFIICYSDRSRSGEGWTTKEK